MISSDNEPSQELGTHLMHLKVKSAAQKSSLSLLLASMVLTCNVSLAAKAPTIRLFPTNVVEDVRETGRVARDLETNLQDVINDLQLQWKLYQGSKCEGAQGDPGCAQIAEQLGEKYLEMLSIMDDQLPHMERSVEATVTSLEGRLRRELGQKMTARELQQVLVNETSRTTNSLAAIRKNQRSSRRLSERFRRYYELVGQANSRTRGSLALVAADIYLDSKEVLELIRLTRDEITRSRLMLEIRNEFGEVTPEMTEVVAGVRNVLFGEEEFTTRDEALPPVDTFQQEYRSPLEF